jgi:hypothetical protein
MANMSEEWRDSIFEMFGPSLGLNVAATRSQAKPTAKPPGFRPNLATATSTFGRMLQP